MSDDYFTRATWAAMRLMGHAVQRRFPWKLDEIEVEIDMTEYVDDLLMGWSIEERTRWEGEGGLIPRPWHALWWSQ